MRDAAWDEGAGKWRVKIRKPKADGSATGEDGSGAFEEFEDTADLLFTGLGALSRWDWPDVEGLKQFKGPVIHSAQWEVGGGDGLASGSATSARRGWEEDVKDWGDKRVAVIGVVRMIVLDAIIIEYWLIFYVAGIFCTSDRSCAPTEGREVVQLCPWQNVARIAVCREQDDGTARPRPHFRQL